MRWYIWKRLTWDGTPGPGFRATQSMEATCGGVRWVDAVETTSRTLERHTADPETTGRGMLIQGTREWRDYQAARYHQNLAVATGMPPACKDCGEYALSHRAAWRGQVSNRWKAKVWHASP